MIAPPAERAGLHNQCSEETSDMKFLCAAAMTAALLMGPAAYAQDAAADNTAILLEKVRADKKLLVAANMNLTEQEATAFWPVYETYQKELNTLNVRIKDTIKRYAEAYTQGAVSDDTAKKLLDESLAIEAAELEMKKSYVPKFGKVLPAAKVARYYQIENKIRSTIKAELAAEIPLVD
jgi:predicted outer membrane protein